MKDDATFHDARLQELAQRLGTGAAERLDVERTAQAVVARLQEEARGPARPSVWSQPAWLKIAAALVVVAGAGVVARAVWPARPGAAAPVETVDLSDMSAPQLRELLRSVEQPGALQHSGRIGQPDRIPIRFDLTSCGPARACAAIKIFKRGRVKKQRF